MMSWYYATQATLNKNADDLRKGAKSILNEARPQASFEQPNNGLQEYINKILEKEM